MTKIAIVRGLNDNRGRWETIPDRMPFMNFLTTTSGEMALLNAKTKLWNYHYFLPEKEKIWAKGAVMIDNALSAGIHGLSPYIGYLPNELRFVAQTIKEAKKRFAPAGNVLFRSSKNLTKGLDLDSVQGLNDGKIDVEEYFRKTFPYCFNNSYNYATNSWDTSMKQTTECYNLHSQVVQMVIKLNEHLPKTSHHSIYQFMTPAEVNNPAKTSPIAAAKYVQHYQFVGGIQKASEIDITNLKNWMRNCIEYRNGKNGLIDTLSPEACIQKLRNNPNLSAVELWNSSEQDKIGDPISFTIILIIIVACKGIAGIIQVCKDKEPTAFAGLEQIAQVAGFAASGTDFAKKRNDDDSGSGSQTDNDKNNGGSNDKEKDEDEAEKKGLMQWISDNPIPSAIGAGLAFYGFTRK